MKQGIDVVFDFDSFELRNLYITRNHTSETNKVLKRNNFFKDMLKDSSHSIHEIIAARLCTDGRRAARLPAPAEHTGWNRASIAGGAGWVPQAARRPGGGWTAAWVRVTARTQAVTSWNCRTNALGTAVCITPQVGALGLPRMLSTDSGVVF